MSSSITSNPRVTQFSSALPKRTLEDDVAELNRTADGFVENSFAVTLSLVSYPIRVALGVLFTGAGASCGDGLSAQAKPSQDETTNRAVPKPFTKTTSRCVDANTIAVTLNDQEEVAPCRENQECVEGVCRTKPGIQEERCNLISVSATSGDAPSQPKEEEKPKEKKPFKSQCVITDVITLNQNSKSRFNTWIVDNEELYLRASIGQTLQSRNEVRRPYEQFRSTPCGEEGVYLDVREGQYPWIEAALSVYSADIAEYYDIDLVPFDNPSVPPKVRGFLRIGDRGGTGPFWQALPEASCSWQSWKRSILLALNLPRDDVVLELGGHPDDPGFGISKIRIWNCACENLLP